MLLALAMEVTLALVFLGFISRVNPIRENNVPTFDALFRLASACFDVVAITSGKISYAIWKIKACLFK